ncbi:MAG: fumarylacetoacetate hydrolase family protein [Actinomycetota bacterium]|nr:fumarylacetoacetate hydrolase family protein [Actinomycetota bacterium]MDK1103631.1 fumarylacetoacetate hydrolase family protein [Actinomycetota bacterium]
MTEGPKRRSWVDVPEGSDFPIQNLPYGVFADTAGVRCGVAIGDSVFDLARAERAGLFTNTGLDRDTFRAESLNVFLGHSRGVWSSVRSHIAEVLDANSPEGRFFCDENHLVIDHPVQMRMPVEVGDHVDFYSSEAHATNVGKMFRPDGEPLLPNWKHIPVGYHGRAGTVVVSGTAIKRPSGRRRGSDGPTFGPSNKLDMELEVGFITGGGPGLGVPIPVDEAEHHIFGLCLVNDWSARDIQAWEYVPLGPFLGKSFATTISPWIIPLEALEPFRVPAGDQNPAPLPYLRSEHHIGLDLDLSADITPSGDTVPIRGRCTAEGAVPIGFGECAGTINP